MSTPPRRRWFQFGLRTMFVLVTVLAVPIALAAWVTHTLTDAMNARAQRRAAPLTNETLDLLTRGQISYGAIEPIKPRSVKVGANTSMVIGSVSLSQDEVHGLIRALGPINVVTPGPLPASSADYQFTFQGGMDPALIYVKIGGDHLEFEWRGFVYHGGDAKAFRELAESVLGRKIQSLETQ